MALNSSSVVIELITPGTCGVTSKLLGSRFDSGVKLQKLIIIQRHLQKATMVDVKLVTVREINDTPCPRDVRSMHDLPQMGIILTIGTCRTAYMRQIHRTPMLGR
jgi:hypothetical protein